MPGEWIPIVAIVVGAGGFFASVVLIVWFAARTINHRAEMRAEQMNNLLDKFGTADDFITFAKSDAGAEIVRAISGGARDESPQVLRSIRRGVISAALGIGAVIVGSVVNDLVWLGVIGALLLALGIGFLVSAYIARRFEADAKAEEESFPETAAEARMSETLGQ